MTLHFTVSWFFWCCFLVGLQLCFSLEELKVLLVLGKLVAFSFALQQRKEVQIYTQCAGCSSDLSFKECFCLGTFNTLRLSPGLTLQLSLKILNGVQCCL